MKGVLIRNNPGAITLEWNGGKEVLPTIKEAFERSDQIKADPNGFGYEWLKTTGLIEEDEVCA